MKIEFKYPRIINGMFYAPGIHEVPESLMNHWYLKALIDCREVLLVDDAPRCLGSGEVVGEIAALPDPEVKKPRRRGMK